MNILIALAMVSIGVLLVTLVIGLIVKKRMTESQGILWIFIGMVIIIVGIFPPLIPYLAGILGIWYPPTIIFVVAFVGLLLIVFKNSIELSKQTNQIHELSMQLTLLKEEYNQLKEQQEKEEGEH